MSHRTELAAVSLASCLEYLSVAALFPFQSSPSQAQAQTCVSQTLGGEVFARGVDYLLFYK